MQHGICTLSVIPARREPSGTSEMVTQLLFGETYTIVEQKNDWLKIRTAIDNYDCWISIKQHTKISESTFRKLRENPPVYCNELVQVISNNKTGNNFPITLAAILPEYNKHILKIENEEFHFDGTVTGSAEKKQRKDIISTAFLFMNAPYLWGGKTPFGIDCSAFTQLTFRLNGYQLPRDSHQQVEHGTALSFVDEAREGDLAFFDNEDGKIVHVGILLNNNQIIHSSGKVKIEKFDHYGIYNEDIKGYSHTLRVIKSIL
jgi:gamma-D-glutamyl-L-lysine dipeptidyl-peptidase